MENKTYECKIECMSNGTFFTILPEELLEDLDLIKNSKIILKFNYSQGIHTLEWDFHKHS